MSDRIPLFPLELVLFPGAALPLHIFEERYKEMLGECIAGNLPFGVVRVHKEGVASVGCTAEVVSLLTRYDDGRMDIMTEGRRRFRILAPDQSRAFLQANVDYVTDEVSDVSDAERRQALAAHTELLHLYGTEAPELEEEGAETTISFALAATLPADLNFKQAILELRSEPERLHLLNEYYNAILPKMRQVKAATRVTSRNGHVM